MSRAARAVGTLVVVISALMLIGTLRAAADSPVQGPSGWPLSPTPEVVRGFDPPAERWGAGNRGLDLAASPGQPVLAAAGGRITYAGMLAGRGVVVVDHGAVRTTYEPVTATLPVGTLVVRGEQIGTISGSHCADRTCLHWGLRRGEEYLDPAVLIGPDPSPRQAGEVRLLPESAVAEVAARVAARAQAGGVGVGPGGDHGFLLPAEGPITSPFGMRTHPVTGVHKLHDGMDVGAPCGTPLRSPADGLVTLRAHDHALGNRLVIDHGIVDGRRVQTSLNHADSLTVAQGQRVTRGDVVGTVGSTGYSTGCHLHLMVWLDGLLIDPATWF